MTKIIQLGDERLRKVSVPVLETEINSPEFSKTLENLSEALRSQSDGVAISAPQIGVNQRVFAVSTKIFDEEYLEGRVENKFFEHVYFVNPVITKFSKKKETAEEGCLSIRGVYGLVERSKNVTIEALNEKGEKFTRGAGGLLARIFQHETDHLDGILFIDRASEIKEIIEEK